MLMASLLHWWYVEGWLEQLTKVRWAFLRVADKFSIGLLIKTLFAPFRQISADEQVRGVSGVATVVLDKLISRLVGGVARLIMIIVGTITLILLTICSLIRLVLWLVLPIAPVIGLAMMTMIGAPWKFI